MLNTDSFSERLKTVMEFYSISASAFADKISVPRSSISHILSGRNNPSLDFVLKIEENFKEVDLTWLLKGIGNFPHKGGQIEKTETPLLSKSKPTEPEFNFSEPKQNLNSEIPNDDSIIERIIFYYTDGTFKEYIPKK